MDDENPSEEGLRNADEIIEILNTTGNGDYSAFRNQIALDIYDNGHWNGNWDVCFDPSAYDEDSTLYGFRVIQEDEYDQHMDEDPDKPEWDDMIADVPNGYLWMN